MSVQCKLDARQANSKNKHKYREKNEYRYNEILYLYVEHAAPGRDPSATNDQR